MRRGKGGGEEERVREGGRAGERGGGRASERRGRKSE